MQQIDQTLVMQQNLQRMIKNQNYFSCFLDNDHSDEQPANPFRKKMFDKNLRRSSMSCGHYNSMSNHSRSETSGRNMDSSRESFNNKISINEMQAKYYEVPLQIQVTHKMTLAQSRHSDPHKQQITRIINSFRLELDYLEEKFHIKIDEANQKYNKKISQFSKQSQIKFMIGSLEKIVGFMIENCVNLQDNVMYGGQSGDVSRLSHQFMKKQIYRIEDQQDEGENISFGEENYRRAHQTDIKKHRKAVGFREEQKENCNNQQNNLPNTFFINEKLQSNEKIKLSKVQKQQIKSNRQDHLKITNRAPSKSKNIKYNQTNPNEFHYHSSKENISYNYSSSIPDHQPIKSIYETVLEQRETRMKMKKKMI